MSTNFRVLCVLLLVGSPLLGGCPTTPSTPSAQPPSQPKAKGEVLATIGTTRITRREFEEAYKQDGHGVEPQDFLKQYIEQKLLFFEARKKGLGKEEQVRHLTRKALAQSAIKSGFEKWFTAKSISILEVRKIYNERRYEYIKPKRVKAWHILALFPRSLNTKPRRRKGAPEPTAAEAAAKKAAREQIITSTKALAAEVLASLKKLNPKTTVAFRAAALPFIHKANRPDPRLNDWFKQLGLVLQTQRNKPGRVLALSLFKLRKQLKQIYYCDLCNAMSAHLKRYVDRWVGLQKKPADNKSFNAFYSTIKHASQRPLERLRVRDLKTFSYQDMVAPFAKAAFSIKDQSFSQELVRTKFGFHIIFRYGTLPASSVPFSQVAPDIRKEIYQKRLPKMFRRWLFAVKKRYDIKRYYERLKILHKKQGGR